MTVISMIRPQMVPTRRIHVLFTPLAKDRMDFVIEKCVELGATDLHPILTDHTDIRRLNDDRIHAQIIEAAEQCERLTLPILHDTLDLTKKLSTWPDDCKIFMGVERTPAPLIRALPRAVFHGRDCGILVGPAGGFSNTEKEKIPKYPCIQPISLGDHILRADTAIIAMLAVLQLKGDDHEL
jgi:16S rRNA (uracil1498-N3)-methyltransferase